MRGRGIKEGNIKAVQAAMAAVEAAQALKAEEVVLLDLRGIATFTDFFVICSGTSQRQVRAIADRIDEKLRANRYSLLHQEGYEEGSWVLLDYVDLVVHVFFPETRDYYDLERLWADAPRMDLKKLPPPAKRKPKKN